MRHGMFALALVAAAVAPVAGHAQIRPFAVSFGAGPAFNDHQNTMLGSRGFSAFVRVTSMRSPFLMDISYVSLPQSDNIVYALPCPPFATSCGGGNQFLGPVSALTLSPAVETVERNSWSAMQYRIGPSVSWLPDRQPGTSAAALGARAGVSLIVKVSSGPGLMVSVDYLRMFRGGQTPQWFVPVTLGLQF